MDKRHFLSSSIKAIFSSVALLSLFWSGGSGALLRMPYTGGKQDQYVEISLGETDKYFGFSYKFVDTLQVGDIFSISIHYVPRSGSLAGLCSQADSEFSKIVVQVSTAGTASRLADSGAYWSEQDVHPPSNSLYPLDTLSWPNTTAIPAAYVLAKEGSCEGVGTNLERKWNRVVYVNSGSAYAKVAVISHKDTAYGLLPSHHYVQKIVVRYIVNEVNELGGPVAIRSVPASSSRNPSGLKVVYDLYNPLGIRLDRNPGRYAPALSNPRKSTSER